MASRLIGKQIHKIGFPINDFVIFSERVDLQANDFSITNGDILTPGHSVSFNWRVDVSICLYYFIGLNLPIHCLILRCKTFTNIVLLYLTEENCNLLKRLLSYIPSILKGRYMRHTRVCRRYLGILFN